ncbi:MAG TPA: hypothetical protein VF665_25570 [Longimicrobium sp.]|uniref:hypothetical protein n=1 Tax=Longimicrobium sp. TaxID=2029185 RepID=UPI002EDBA371
MNPTVRAALLAGALLAASAPAAAQANVIRIPGKVVEVIGLEEWTVAMLQDSLRAHGEVSLDSHACAAVLQEKLGFPVATSSSYRFAGDTVEHVVVTLVEPGAAARVRRLKLGADTLTLVPEWGAARGALGRWAGVFLTAVQMNDARDPLPEPFRKDSAGFRLAWAFLDAHGTAADRALARRVLRADSGMYSRVIAASLLGRAPAEATDGDWHAAVRATRDTEDRVAAAAGMSLAALARAPRRVDWAPAVNDVHAVLDGASLWHLDEVMAALVASGADSRWAAPFLAGGGHAVLARLQSSSPRVRGPAHRLLVALRGEDLGADEAAWRAWVGSLRRAE